MFLKEEKSLRDVSPVRVHTISGSSPQRSKEQDCWLSSHTSAIEGLKEHGGKMRVILRENIENLGKKGDIVNVAPGYGRNYLIPKKIAIEVTSRNMKMIEIEKKVLQKGLEKEMASYQEFIDQLNAVTLSFTRKASEKDIIFGSVSATDIRDALVDQGFDVEKKKILLDEPIKRLGNYTVPIKIFHEERAEVKLEVVKEGEPGIKEEKELELDLVEKETPLDAQETAPEEIMEIHEDTDVISKEPEDIPEDTDVIPEETKDIPEEEAKEIPKEPEGPPDESEKTSEEVEVTPQKEESPRPFQEEGEAPEEDIEKSESASLDEDTEEDDSQKAANKD
jgi:large subunit ribosomal protein L9